MENDNNDKKTDRPSCGCSRPDLYYESLKQKENKLSEDTDPTTPDQTNNNNCSIDLPNNDVSKSGNSETQ